MPPKRAKKNASNASEDAIPSFPAPTTTTQQDEAHTPEQSPRKQTVGITQAQKQALMDNLQLEITERARKLRAQYALQAQGLRSRLEMRVNRIPTAMRKRKMQDLLDEQADKAEPKPASAVLAKKIVQPDEVEERPKKAMKRTSEHISDDHTVEDKENAAPTKPLQPESQELPVAKKRTKAAAATANTKAARTASRANNTRPLQSSAVLSPKSHNSRTLPRSPFKATSPEKPLPTRPVNTAKPARTASRQQQGTAATKKLAPTAASEREQRSSGVSDSSAGTTIVQKPGAKGRVAAAAKKTTAAVGRAAAAAGKKGAAAAGGVKKENVPSAGGRTLRKRG